MGSGKSDNSDDSAHRLPNRGMQQRLSGFRRKSLLLPHDSTSLVPSKLPDSSSATISTAGTLTLLLVIRMAATAPATDMCGLLPLAHAWSTLRHAEPPRTTRPPANLL